MTIQSLFKYGKVNEHAEEVFSTPKIWFSAPAQLNDPFECRPWLTFNGTRDQIIESLVREIRRLNPNMTPHGATAEAVSIFLQGRHRDPMTWEALRQDLIETLGQKIGLYCLSETSDSILMWSHYADDHRGYCLEFEATDTTPFFGAAQQVIYNEVFPEVDIYNTPKEEQLDHIFLTKFHGWSYEKEWRIIDHETGPGIHDYPPQLLKGVIFGFRMPEADRNKVKAWIKSAGRTVKYFEAQRHDRQFKIVINEMD